MFRTIHLFSHWVYGSWFLVFFFLCIPGLQSCSSVAVQGTPVKAMVMARDPKVFGQIPSQRKREVVADRMFKKGEKVCLIDFQGLPDRIAKIIREQGFELLQIDVEKERLEAVAGRVLDFAGTSFQPPPARFGYESEDKYPIRLSVPGYLIRTDQGNVLLTRVNLDKNIIIYLSEKNINIIKY